MLNLVRNDILCIRGGICFSVFKIWLYWSLENFCSVSNLVIIALAVTSVTDTTASFNNDVFLWKLFIYEWIWVAIYGIHFLLNVTFIKGLFSGFNTARKDCGNGFTMGHSEQWQNMPRFHYNINKSLQRGTSGKLKYKRRNGAISSFITN